MKVVLRVSPIETKLFLAFSTDEDIPENTSMRFWSHDEEETDAAIASRIR
jgi:hypothetical protein